MRVLSRTLLRLYPATWRQRYGDEFAALVEDVPPGMSTNFDLLKGAIHMQLVLPAFPKLALVLSVAGLIAGLGISFLVTPRYTSTAVLVLKDNSSGPAAHKSAMDSFIQYKGAVMSRTSLSEMIQDPHLTLYQNELAKQPLEEVVDIMRRDIRINIASMGDRTTIFSIQFTYPDQRKVQATVQALVTKFIGEGYLERRVRAFRERPQENVLLEQIALLEARVATLEHRAGVPRMSGVAPVLPEGVTLTMIDDLSLRVMDPPSYSRYPVFPNRVSFMAAGFGAGISAALLIAVFRRRYTLTPSLPVAST